MGAPPGASHVQKACGTALQCAQRLAAEDPAVEAAIALALDPAAQVGVLGPKGMKQSATFAAAMGAPAARRLFLCLC